MKTAIFLLIFGIVSALAVKQYGVGASDFTYNFGTVKNIQKSQQDPIMTFSKSEADVHRVEMILKGSRLYDEEISELLTDVKVFNYHSDDKPIGQPLPSIGMNFIVLAILMYMYRSYWKKAKH